MHRAALRQRKQKRRRTGLDAMRTVSTWLNEQKVGYCKTVREARNRGLPPLMVLTAPPACSKIPGVAIYIWPGGYAQITKSQDRWIKHFDKKGWCVLLTHSSDEVLKMLKQLGYERQNGDGGG